MALRFYSNPLGCGVPIILPSTVLTKIVHGQSVRPHSWPWQVALIDTTDETQFCGGTEQWK